MKQLIASLALCGLATAPAFAATFIGSTGGTSIVTDYSDSGLISFDLDLKDTTPVTLSYQLTTGDLSGLDFNAVLRNLTGAGLTQFSFSLNAASFQSLGTVTRSFDPAYSLSTRHDGHQALISFGSPEYLDVAIGNPLGTAGAQNWVIDTSSLNAGDVLTVTAAVPEPESCVMALLGLAAIGAFVRRRQA
jgi:hypothetical protein